MEASFRGSVSGTENGSEHEKYPLKHQGHERIDAHTFLALILTLLGVHIGLVLWKKYHFRSYQTATLIGLLLVPVCVCAMYEWYEFVVIWFTFCVSTTVVLSKAMKRPVAVNTPRLVYKYFYVIHLLSSLASVTGLLMLLIGILDLDMLFVLPQKKSVDIGLHLLYYGLYYGVTGRD